MQSQCLYHPEDGSLLKVCTQATSFAPSSWPWIKHRGERWNTSPWIPGSFLEQMTLNSSLLKGNELAKQRKVGKDRRASLANDQQMHTCRGERESTASGHTFHRLIQPDYCRGGATGRGVAGQGLTRNASRTSSQNSGESQAVYLGRLNNLSLKQDTFDGEQRCCLYLWAQQNQSGICLCAAHLHSPASRHLLTLSPRGAVPLPHMLGTHHSSFVSRADLGETEEIRQMACD